MLQESVLVVLMFIGSVSALASPYILKIIIDDVFPSRNFTFLLQVLAIYAGISIARIFITYASNYLFAWVSNYIMKDIRIDVFAHLVRLPLSFYNENKQGDIIHRINSEVNSIQNILTGSVVRIINSVCTIIGITVLLCILNWKLFLISLVVMPFIFLNTRYFQPKIQKNIKAGRLKDSEILSYFMESFTNIRLIKSYMNYRSEEEKINKHLDEQIVLNLSNVRLTSTTRNISLLLTAFVPILVLGLGGKDVIGGTMTVGALVAFIQYMNRLFDPFRDLMGLYFDLVRAVVSMDRIHEILEIQPEKETGINDKRPNTTAASLEGKIVFKNVSFSYNESEPVLHNIDLSFEPGKTYALVGSSGCGKSTIINLLCRFYNTVRGGIYLGGQRIDQFDLYALRSRINLVSQDNQLFHDTILNNITYGNAAASQEQAQQAAQLSYIYDYIREMPSRFDSMVGDQGVTLSGGQKQRIGIARSMLRTGADIILLDEATSAIDSDTESRILENICRANKGKIIIVVSHRLSAIKDVDQIICLNNGAVEETGTHTELLEKRGFYWNLFRNQI